ncbi:MAG TPA: TolC family protein [Candidatus Rifleibacterium sp.]|nr:TolC family protein [Candidatus Rifleibacterium sp.]HPT45637.1 TolC family protein [Candidatus Rifleibacterium sp.]
MKHFFKLLLAGLLATSSVAVAQQQPVASAPWTLEDCLRHGLDRHPRLKIAESGIAAEKARLLQTGAAYDARVNLRAGWNHSKIDAAKGRNLADPTTDSTSESVSASKLLYDSGQTALQKKAARASLSAAGASLDATRTDLAAGIKSAYFRAQQAMALLQVRQETLEGYERHLAKVESYVEVGTRAPFDITRAQVDVANARVELISARSNFKVALANLARAIGLETVIEVAPYSEETAPANVDGDHEKLLADAMSRPDVKVAMHQVAAADYRVKEARLSRSPSLSASADYQWSGTAAPLDRQWGMGVSLSWPVLDGAVTRAQIDSAKSSFESSAAGLENVKLSVTAELENSLTGLTDALERLQATTILVQQASESMNLAEGRYDAGLGSPLEITDARVEYAKARGNRVVAFYDSLIAQAEVDRVLGRLPAEYRIQAIVPEESGEKTP